MMKRLIVLTFALLLAASTVGCNRPLLRNWTGFFRGAPCTTNTMAPCQMTPVYEGEYLPPAATTPVLPAPGPGN